MCWSFGMLGVLHTVVSSTEEFGASSRPFEPVRGPLHAMFALASPTLPHPLPQAAAPRHSGPQSESCPQQVQRHELPMEEVPCRGGWGQRRVRFVRTTSEGLRFPFWESGRIATCSARLWVKVATLKRTHTKLRNPLCMVGVAPTSGT